MADDVNSAKKFEELAVELFNDFATTTLQGGETQPKTGIIITANSAFAETQRLVINYVYAYYIIPNYGPGAYFLTVTFTTGH